MNIVEELKVVAKAIVPLVVGAVVILLGHFGVTGDMTVSQAVQIAVVSVLTSLGVYQVPNKKA